MNKYNKWLHKTINEYYITNLKLRKGNIGFQVQIKNGDITWSEVSVFDIDNFNDTINSSKEMIKKINNAFNVKQEFIRFVFENDTYEHFRPKEKNGV